MGGVLKTIGKVVSAGAPFAALIPGVGPLAAAGIGAGGGLLSGGDVIKPALMGAAGGYANKALLGGQGLDAFTGNPMMDSAPSNFFSGLEGKIGKLITNPNVLGNKEGKLDVGKTLGATTAGLNIYGQQKQMKQQDKYNKANTRLKNQVLSQLLTPGPNLSSNSTSPIFDQYSGVANAY